MIATLVNFMVNAVKPKPESNLEFLRTLTERLGNGEDVIHQCRVERDELKENDARYRSLLSILPYSIFVVSDNTIAFTNSAATLMLGGSKAGAFKGVNVDTIFDEASILELDKCYFSVSEKPAVGVELTLTRIDKVKLMTEALVFPLQYQGKLAILIMVLMAVPKG